MKSIIAIDPGASGGIAILYHDGRVGACKMPETPRDICDMIDEAHRQASLNSMDICAYMEQVGGFAGGPGQPGSAMFNFGQSFGEIIGILTHAKIRFTLVGPQKWMKAFSVPSKGLLRGDYTGMGTEVAKAERQRIGAINAKLKTAHKNRLKELAQRNFPMIPKITLSTADALLILGYAKQQEGIAGVAPIVAQQSSLVGYA